jgi:hypothetical protein
MKLDLSKSEKMLKYPASHVSLFLQVSTLFWCFDSDFETETRGNKEEKDECFGVSTSEGHSRLSGNPLFWLNQNHCGVPF